MSSVPAMAWLVLLVDAGAIGWAIAYAVTLRRSTFALALGLVIGGMALGLFGTVLCLLHSFAAVAGVDPSMKATLLAKGISEAMSCTAIGLGSIVPWLVPFTIGVVRADRRRTRRTG